MEVLRQPKPQLLEKVLEKVRFSPTWWGWEEEWVEADQDAYKKFLADLHFLTSDIQVFFCVCVCV